MEDIGNKDFTCDITVSESAGESMITATISGGDDIPATVTLVEAASFALGLATHLVLYTDGGCLQDKKLGGYGVHGYLYFAEPAKQGTGCKKAVPTPEGYVLTSSLKDYSGKPDITVTHYVDAFGTIMSEATNNVAELRGAIEALKIVAHTGVKHAYLRLDSEYVLKGMQQWLPKWLKNGWVGSTGQPVANRSHWEEIHTLLTSLEAADVKLSFKWVKGHNGEFGNEAVDKLATLSLRSAVNGRSIREQKIVDAKGYWKSAKSHSRFLNLPTWYYGVREDAIDTSNDGTNRAVYYMGNITEDVEYTGKVISDASFAVVYLKEPDPVLERIRAESYLLAKASFYGLAAGNLPIIFKPETYELIEDYGTQFLTYDLSKNRLITTDKNREVLVKELRPVRRAYFAVDRLVQLETTLLNYIACWREMEAFPHNAKNGFVYTDITDLLYEVVPGKKSSSIKLRPSITQSSRTLTCEVDCKPTGQDVTKAKVLLLLAQDLPDRNTLSALAELEPKVTVVTWADSSSVIRFATIIQTTDDIGIWSGVYSNLHILPTKG